MSVGGILMTMTLIPKQYKTPPRNLAPDRWQKRAMLGMVGMVLLTFMVGNLWALMWQTSDWLVATVLPSVVVDLTNSERERSTVGGLVRSEQLDAAAQLKAEHMAAEGYFAHYSPSGVTPWHWFDQVGYVYAHAGENLAVHFTDSRALVQAWMDSPTHRDNIVNEKFTEIGVGTARGRYQGFETVFVVQLFGTPARRPAPAAVQREVVQESEVEEETIIVPTTTVADREEVSPAVPTEPVPSPTDSSSVEIAGEGQSAPEQSGPQVAEDSVDTATEEEVLVSTALADEADNDSPILMSGTHTTSTGAEPATSTAWAGIERGSPAVAGLATQPRMVMQWVYGLLSLGVFAMIIWSLQIEARRRRFVQVVYSYGLLVAMGGLLYIHAAVTSSVLVG